MDKEKQLERCARCGFSYYVTWSKEAKKKLKLPKKGRQVNFCPFCGWSGVGT